MTVESVKVPQHLELEDVVAWGLGVVDLLCVLAGAAAGWWLYLVIPGDVVLRITAATPAVLTGLSIGLLRLGGVGLRQWIAIAVRYASRPRVLITGGGW
jgi:hypothetical protein